MALVKMQYGIDLGTTNSALCKLENGVAVIKKTDTLKDTLPSCVAFTKKQVVKVGDSAYNDNRSEKARATKKWVEGTSNVFLEFKRTMGLNTVYHSSNLDRDYNSEELSAEVLKTLKSFVNEENITSAIITIPAKFKTDQIAATKRAANMAGITHCELLQEPIAAAMAYGLSSNKSDGYWLVFDFGGGTFDAALLSVEDGILQVKDTEGDNYLGGKNLDYAIVDKILIPYLEKEYFISSILDDEVRKTILRDALKFYAEQAKNQLSFKEQCDITSQLEEFGEDDDETELELDLVITRDEIEDAIAPLFQKAIDICQKLLNRNSLTGNSLNSLILVGGLTHSPILRDMLKKQITSNLDTSIDPMTAVATGAALYASTIDTEITVKESNVEQIVALNVQYESNTVESEEFVTVKYLKNESKGLESDNVFVELVRGDKAWSSGKVQINEIGDVIECSLLEDKTNLFRINVYDEQGSQIKSFPTEINIIHGTKVGNAVLPYNIGIEVTDIKKGKDVFVPIKGLEKNQFIPAVGVRNGLKLSKTLRPGMSSDRLVIPIYQGEYDAEGTKACYNDHVFDVIITGDDVPAVIPADSDLDITVKIDRSQMMTLEVMFPIIGESIEKKIEVNSRETVNITDIENLLSESKDKLNQMESSDIISDSEISEARNLINDLSERFDSEKNSEDGKMHLLADIRRAFLSMDKVDDKHEEEKLASNITELLDKIVMSNEILGSKNNVEVERARKIANSALGRKNIGHMKEALEALNHIHIGITFIFQLMNLIKSTSENFYKTKWKNESKAKQIVDKASSLVENNPTVEELRPLVAEIFSLMDVPESEKPKLG